MNESAIKQMSDREKAMLSSGGNYALQGATMGATLGPVGAVIGGLGGLAYGAYTAGEAYDDEQETLAKATEAANKTAAEADKIKRKKELDEVVKNSMVTSDPAVQPDIATLNISNTGSALGQISKVMMKKQLAPIESRYTNLKQSAMQANRGNMFMKMSGASDIAKVSGIMQPVKPMDEMQLETYEVVTKDNPKGTASDSDYTVYGGKESEKKEELYRKVKTQSF